MHMQNMVKFHQFVLKISIKDHNFVKILRKLTRNNPNVDLVNINAHVKFGHIPSIFSQDIERKQNSDINQGP